MNNLRINISNVHIYHLLCTFSLLCFFYQSHIFAQVFYPEKTSIHAHKIVFLSDTQSPIWIETLHLDRNNNEIARQSIFEEVISEKISTVFHLGDLVSFGFLDAAWKEIDKFVETLKKQSIGFYPVLGNHEVLLFAGKGEEKFQKRFPKHRRSGYAVIIDKIGIILLNSNFSILSKKEIEEQQGFLKNTIQEFESDSLVSAIILGCHHPPFTNSKIVDPNEKVQSNFVPYFLASNKCKAFISGHSHAFEHFKHSGKDFFVIGGGGGLQHPLYIEQEEKWADQYSTSNEKRGFHFLECEIKRDSLQFNLKMLNGSFKNFVDGYHIKIQY